MVTLWVRRIGWRRGNSDEFHGGGVVPCCCRRRETEGESERTRRGSKRRKPARLLHVQNVQQGQLTPVKGLHVLRRLWHERHVVNVGLLEHANPAETLPFLGLYLSMHTSIAQGPLLNVVELREISNKALRSKS
jgi:hypothetical protein